MNGVPSLLRLSQPTLDSGGGRGLGCGRRRQLRGQTRQVERQHALAVAADLLQPLPLVLGEALRQRRKQGVHLLAG
jgi:hypothetical protein